MGILKVFKNVQINISFLDAINQISSHDKFLKDLATVKRKTFVPREATFIAQASCLSSKSLLQNVRILRAQQIQLGWEIRQWIGVY